MPNLSATHRIIAETLAGDIAIGDDLAVTGDVTIGGSQTTTGTASVTGQISGGSVATATTVDVGTDLTVTGNTTMNGTATLGATSVLSVPSGATVRVNSGGTLLLDSGAIGTVTARGGLVIGADAAVIDGTATVTQIIMPHGTQVTHNIFTADQAYIIRALRCTPSLAQGGALTAVVSKVTGTATPAAATTPMMTGSFNLNATAHTVQSATLTATGADLLLAAGERIGITLSAALTVGIASFTAVMVPR